jgi:hypothetical protein
MHPLIQSTMLVLTGCFIGNIVGVLETTHVMKLEPNLHPEEHRSILLKNLQRSFIGLAASGIFLCVDYFFCV